MKTSSNTNAALIAYLNHEIESALKEQAAFGESASKDVESALQWRASGALVAVFTARHAKTALDQVKLGRPLLPIYENLVDRLMILASSSLADTSEMRAIAVLLLSLKEWLA